MKYSEKIEKEARILLNKFNDDAELAVACANECYIALSQLPHLNQEISNAIYKELDFYRDVIEEIEEMPVDDPCPSDNGYNRNDYK